MGVYEDTRRLEQLLEQTPGTLLPNRTSLGVIRERIKTLVGDSPVPFPCQELKKIYETMLQRANNAVSGGGSPSNFGAVWGNFIKAAKDYLECLKAQRENGPE
jgi:hypothetical protein